MPTWCRYCHQTGHTKFECEKSKARIICYNCQQMGHRSFECPRKIAQMKPKRRKGRKVNEVETEDSSSKTNRLADQTPPSKETLKSKYATGGQIRKSPSENTADETSLSSENLEDQDDPEDADFNMDDADSILHSDTDSDMEDLDFPDIDTQEHEDLLRDQQKPLTDILGVSQITGSTTEKDTSQTQQISLTADEQEELEALHQSLNQLDSGDTKQVVRPGSIESNQ